MVEFRSAGTKSHEKEIGTRKGSDGRRSDSDTSSRKAHTNIHMQTRGERSAREDGDRDRKAQSYYSYHEDKSY